MLVGLHLPETTLVYGLRLLARTLLSPRG
jgi:hypothetical protein